MKKISLRDCKKTEKMCLNNLMTRRIIDKAARKKEPKAAD